MIIAPKFYKFHQHPIITMKNNNSINFSNIDEI